MEHHKSHIAALPIELRIKILNHLDSPPTLLAVITTSRSFHDAYLESQTSIRTSTLLNSTNSTSAHCNFLTYALLVFHNKPYLQLSRLHRFLKSYLSFANPVDGVFSKSACEVVPWEKCAPPGFYEKREEVREHVFRWAKKFCDDKLRIFHDEGSDSSYDRNCDDYPFSPLQPSSSAAPVNNYKPPTDAEVARAARAFYRYFLYTLVSSDNYFHTDDMDNLGRPVTGKPDEDTLLAFIESIPYVDFKVVDWFGRQWITELVDPTVREMIGDVKNPVRREPARWGISAMTLQHRVAAVTQALVTRLGPVELWKFMFESTYTDRFKVYCQHPAALDRESFAPWSTFMVFRGQSKTYDPRMRICTGESDIVGSAYMWWEGSGEDNNVVREAIMWDGWRLVEKGLRYPKFENKVDFHWMGTRWRDAEFQLVDGEDYLYPCTSMMYC
ncbi:hypothetical protein ABW20_dc0103355 [Dactylellina cionopaga]|nr:hypothetical protein ABW20_dc0103355 [Dactylellina cionopaga]